MEDEEQPVVETVAEVEEAGWVVVKEGSQAKVVAERLVVASTAGPETLVVEWAGHQEGKVALVAQAVMVVLMAVMARLAQQKRAIFPCGAMRIHVRRHPVLDHQQGIGSGMAAMISGALERFGRA